MYSFLTGEGFVSATAKLHRLPDPETASRRAIAIVEMADAQDRRISTYSKGMAIRRLMTSRSHVFVVRISDDRRLGAALIGRPAVTGVASFALKGEPA